MENLYYNLEKKTKKFSKLFWILSIISWFVYTIISSISIINIYSERAGILFTIVKYPIFIWYSQSLPYRGGTIYPLQMHPIFFYIIASINSLIALISFCILLYTMKKNNKISIINEILSDINEFIFFPLLCISILYLIGLCHKFNDSRWERRNILGIIFDIIGLLTIIFIYHKTEFDPNSKKKYIYIIIKKVAYSCIICLEWFYFCYIITNFFILYLSIDYYFSIIKILGIILPIIFGLGSIIFAFIYKDITISLLSCLINIGCAMHFFCIDIIYRKQFNKYVDGIIYITMSVLLIIETFIISKYSEIKTKNTGLNIEFEDDDEEEDDIIND